MLGDQLVHFITKVESEAYQYELISLTWEKMSGWKSKFWEEVIKDIFVLIKKYVNTAKYLFIFVQKQTKIEYLSTVKFQYKFETLSSFYLCKLF